MAFLLKKYPESDACPWVPKLATPATYSVIYKEVHHVKEPEKENDESAEYFYNFLCRKFCCFFWTLFGTKEKAQKDESEPLLILDGLLCGFFFGLHLLKNNIIVNLALWFFQLVF